MEVKNNYQECLTNLACSIRKYFDLEYHHNTIPDIDQILTENKPKNVVLILFDGMGSNIAKRVLPKDSFLIRHLVKPITTVFPATTVAATTSITTGLNPVETGMLGWNMYYKDLDKVITTYFNVEKSDPNKVVLEDAIAYKKKHMITKTIVEEINEKGQYHGSTLMPFGDNPYQDLDEMCEKIKTICNSEGRQYIYAYDDEPDHLMHSYGTECKEVKDLIRYRNIIVERLSKKLTNTIIIVVADHGHIPVENIHLEEYPAIVECLSKNTSLESRAVNFFIKKDMKDIFVKRFNQEFSNDFDLYTKEDVIESHLFGDGQENEIFRDALGDYLAIAKTNKALLYNGNEPLKSQHAGYTDDEIYVPLIVINRMRGESNEKTN